MAQSGHPTSTAPPSQPPSSSYPLTERATKDDNGNGSAEDDDCVTIHVDESINMFVEVNPEIEQASTWDPPCLPQKAFQ